MENADIGHLCPPKHEYLDFKEESWRQKKKLTNNAEIVEFLYGIKINFNSYFMSYTNTDYINTN